VFERFTERSRQVLVLAQDEARDLKHNYIGTEHILLGLLREETGVAARVLAGFDVTHDEVRNQIARIVGEGDEITSGQIPFTPRAKKVLELALREALQLQSGYIGTEHLLLGIARENQGVAARILLDFAVDADKIRSGVMDALGGRAAHPRPIPQPIERKGEHALGFVAHEGLPNLSPGSRFSLLAGWILFGISLGIGVLIGWAIWGL
jgi:ATP-dependent Clp protease ATP-binding subunit ClpA